MALLEPNVGLNYIWIALVPFRAECVAYTMSSMSAGWIQYRETESPKEYHYDSALTWCRDNGWTQEQLGHCPFYPQIGSIFYLTAAGGPTGSLSFSLFSSRNCDVLLTASFVTEQLSLTNIPSTTTQYLPSRSRWPYRFLRRTGWACSRATATTV